MSVVSPRLRRLQIRWAMTVYHGLLSLMSRRSVRSEPTGRGRLRILLTGTFHSDNWIRAHLGPLADSRYCESVTMVASTPVPATEGVRTVVPPRWLVRVVGRVAARLLVFIVVAVRTRPHVVGGFHLLINGLVALLLGRAIGARTLYFCVGGPVELLGGGVAGENPYFAAIGVADEGIERALLDAVGQFDLIIAMGSRARSFFEARGIRTNCQVLPGGIDPRLFGGVPSSRATDLVLVARLVPIKRIDVFLRAVSRAAEDLPELRAAVVGDGPLRSSLEGLARELGIDHRVTFAGQVADVGTWLRQSKIFVLTSDSEGLALSLMEAMCCGLPAIVRRVGDLEDLVEPGVNGHLVEGEDPDAFAERFRELLSDPERLERLAGGARRASVRLSRDAATRAWDVTLQRMLLTHEWPPVRLD